MNDSVEFLQLIEDVTILKLKFEAFNSVLALGDTKLYYAYADKLKDIDNNESLKAIRQRIKNL